MDENQTETADSTVVVQYELPSVKDQLISAAIGVAVTIVAPIVVLGTLSLVSTGASKYKAHRAAKRLAKTEPILTPETE